MIINVHLHLPQHPSNPETLHFSWNAFLQPKNSKHNFSTPQKKISRSNCRTKKSKNLRSSGTKREAKWIDFPPSLLVATRSAPPRSFEQGEKSRCFGWFFCVRKKRCARFFKGKGGFRKRCFDNFLLHMNVFFFIY